MPTSKTVVVAGATGRLGEIVDALIERGHRVRALTRDPGSNAAARLLELGAEVHYGDFDEPHGVARAATGADAMFATGTAHRVGPDGELRHGIAIADAAAAAGVGQLVYVSGEGAAADSPLPLMRTKFAVERHIASLPTGYTILAPVYYMENLFNPWNLPSLTSRVLPSPVPIDLPIQQAAVADVVALAVAAIEQPKEFDRKRVAVASDELTAVDAAAAITAAIGIEMEPKRLDTSMLPPGLRALFAWLETDAPSVDLDQLHGNHPEVRWSSYADWAESQRARFRALCPHPHAEAVAH